MDALLMETAIMALVITIGLMTLLWLFSLVIRNASIVDIFWGTGFVIVAWVYFLNSQGFEPRNWLVAALVTIWGLRLSIHIFIRNVGHAEDFRYRAWREQYGQIWWLRSYFHVFLLQGLILWFVSLPILAAMQKVQSWSIFDFVGIALWLIGFIFEAGGDWQLSRFKAKPENKGKLLTSGLWSLTRHPNYFGDAVSWWGFFTLSLPLGFWTIFSPVLMTFLLRRVSGVAMLERSMKVKPGYEDYMKNTPAFFPRFPTRESSEVV